VNDSITLMAVGYWIQLSVTIVHTTNKYKWLWKIENAPSLD